ncbi:MAG: DUF6888 family protein [Nostoc sp. DedSLP01]
MKNSIYSGFRPLKPLKRWQKILVTPKYLPIYLVRLDERTKHIYILAGQSFEVEILPNGKVRYL